MGEGEPKVGREACGGERKSVVGEGDARVEGNGGLTERGWGVWVGGFFVFVVSREGRA